jgi:hypothetical protein
MLRQSGTLYLHRSGPRRVESPDFMPLIETATLAHDAIRLVRIGTLDRPDLLPPDSHIYTNSKQPWVVLTPGVPAVEEYHQRSRFWPTESLSAGSF